MEAPCLVVSDLAFNSLPVFRATFNYRLQRSETVSVVFQSAQFIVLTHTRLPLWYVYA